MTMNLCQKIGMIFVEGKLLLGIQATFVFHMYQIYLALNHKKW